MQYKLFLPEQPCIGNEHFEIYCSTSLTEYSKEVMDYITKQKKSILDFFGLENFRKVQINLYDNSDIFKKFTRQFFEAPSYCIGHFALGMVNFYISGGDLRDNKWYQQRIRGITHEFVHLVYKEEIQEKGNNNRVVWLDEGLAQYLSGQKSALEDKQKFKDWFLRQVARRDKIVPDILFLKKHGDMYGAFYDTETNKYNGYDISYSMVRFLAETLSEDQFQTLIRKKKAIEEIEASTLNESINYYSKMFEVKEEFNDLSTEQELLDYMNKNVLYGWKDYNGLFHYDTMEDFRNSYRTSSVEETIANNIGTCIEQSRMENELFTKIGLRSKMFALRSYELEERSDQEVKMHCFCLFEKDNKIYHFEHSNPLIPGIYEYASEEDALESICEYYRKRDKGKNRRLNEFTEVPEGISFREFNQYLNQLDNTKTKTL